MLSQRPDIRQQRQLLSNNIMATGVWRACGICTRYRNSRISFKNIYQQSFIASCDINHARMLSAQQHEFHFWRYSSYYNTYIGMHS